MGRSRAPKAPHQMHWSQSNQLEGSETRVEEWGTVAGFPMPDQLTAKAAIDSPFQPEGEKLRKGETEQETGVSISQRAGRKPPAVKLLGAWH
jgi:hypothetical protein